MTGEMMLARAARKPRMAQPARERAPAEGRPLLRVPERAPEDLGPLPRAPEPPALDERIPVEPRAALDRAQAERLLALAKDARAAVQRVIARGGEPGARPGERAAAERAKGCMSELVARLPDLDRAIATLESAAAPNGRPPAAQGSLDLAEIQAIEAFAKCAGSLIGVPEAAGTSGSRLVRAATGVGIPAVLAVLLSL